MWHFFLASTREVPAEICERKAENNFHGTSRNETLSIFNDLKQIALKMFYNKISFFFFFLEQLAKYLNQFSQRLLLISLLFKCETWWSKRQIIESRCATFSMAFSQAEVYWIFWKVQKLSATHELWNIEIILEIMLSEIKSISLWRAAVAIWITRKAAFPDTNHRFSVIFCCWAICFSFEI